MGTTDKLQPCSTADEGDKRIRDKPPCEPGTGGQAPTGRGHDLRGLRTCASPGLGKLEKFFPRRHKAKRRRATAQSALRTKAQGLPAASWSFVPPRGHLGVSALASGQWGRACRTHPPRKEVVVWLGLCHQGPGLPQRRREGRIWVVVRGPGGQGPPGAGLSFRYSQVPARPRCCSRAPSSRSSGASENGIPASSPPPLSPPHPSPPPSECSLPPLVAEPTYPSLPNSQGLQHPFQGPSSGAEGKSRRELARRPRQLG